MEDQCPICGESDEMQDARTLRMSYGYKLDEASVKLEHHFYRSKADADAAVFPDLRPFYSIRTCKDCRADFIGLLRSWCAGQIAAGRHEYVPDERNIPVRVDGSVKWMTRSEWNAYTGKEPFFTMPWEPTHYSVRDHSTVRLVSEDPFIIENEDGDRWDDDPTLWRRIGE